MTETNSYITSHQEEINQSLEHFKKELSGLRTGRAQVTLVENLQVEAYGGTTPLNQLANLSVADAKSIVIEAWDKSILKEIEKALSYSNLGLSVTNTGEKLIAQVPPMTEENRKELIKIMGGKVEQAKIKIRQIRDKVKESILEAEKSKEISEDDKYKFLDDLDKYVADYNKQIEQLAGEKEIEIMKI